MNITREQAKALAKVIGLDIPEDEFDDVVQRLDSLLAIMQEIEAEIGDRLDDVDPIPPVFPREDF
jgi:Asp-tRNA(Asn)/Glu-tRNA(Gln) amidotransferase C subunit